MARLNDIDEDSLSKKLNSSKTKQPLREGTLMGNIIFHVH